MIYSKKMTKLIPIIAHRSPPSSYFHHPLAIFLRHNPNLQTIPRICDNPGPNSIKLKEAKLTHFHFYAHDFYSGKHPSTVQVVPPPSNNSATQFGFIGMIDGPVTVGPKLSSKLVGRAQGFYGSASQEEFSFILVMNLVLNDEKYKNSTITILGRETTSLKVREMPAIGGSGIFRFARGYAEARNCSFQGINAVIEYDVYVLHY